MGGMVRRAVVVLGLVLAMPLAWMTSASADLTLTASSARLSADRTNVVLRGSYTCGPFASGLPDRGVIDFSIEQVRSTGTVTAFGYLEPSVCDGSPQPYRITLTGTAGLRFSTGTATWGASGYVEGDGGRLEHVHVEPAPITLRR
jgi:hypothetical protein